MQHSDSYEVKRLNEEKLHAHTREENDNRLASQHDSIKNAENREALEPFAKAYLGLFLEIDSTFEPEQRIRFIASDKLANAVLQGIATIVLQGHLPTAEDIGKQLAADNRFEIGYVVLVSMDLLLKEYNDPTVAFSYLSPEVLSSALCFHYANSSEFRNKWVTALIEYDRELVTQTLQKFWVAQMDKGVRFLPGLAEHLKTNSGQQLVGEIILPILSGWSQYKKKTLNVLLVIALRYSDKKQLLPIIESILGSNQRINPRMRMVWLTSAFILNPECYWQSMQDYTYRSKEKLLPLLDYTVALLDEITLDINVLTKIIRLIAPKFPPHIDDFGELAANPQKTLRLFYELANREDNIKSQVEWLRSARVMKIVSPILDEVVRLNKEKQLNNTFPEYRHFMSELLNNGKLKEKRSRFKNKL